MCSIGHGVVKEGVSLLRHHRCFQWMILFHWISFLCKCVSAGFAITHRILLMIISYETQKPFLAAYPSLPSPRALSSPSLQSHPPHGNATHSISTSTPFGNSFTATQLLAGLGVPPSPPKCFSYSAFISAKSPMSVRNTVILTTFSSDDPPAASTQDRLVMQREVLYPMLPAGREPSARAGSWPDT